MPRAASLIGLRALSQDRPIAPDVVEQYLGIKFGDALKFVRSAIKRLARSMSAPEIAAQADELYEKFRRTRSCARIKRQTLFHRLEFRRWPRVSSRSTPGRRQGSIRSVGNLPG